MTLSECTGLGTSMRDVGGIKVLLPLRNRTRWDAINHTRGRGMLSHRAKATFYIVAGPLMRLNGFLYRYLSDL